ncbi:MAG: PQQ-binding-like beta-propeller repeat protein [Bryobacterales bacterium]|nr:PQQ-binding-like beta-propeller repeat protein [Bryobacterales bacterium]
MREFRSLATVALLSLAAVGPWLSARAQDRVPQGYESEAELFEKACATCHTPAGEDRTPGVMMLRALSPRAVVASLEDGVMQAEGADLTPEQRVRLAEFLTGRAYAREMLPESAFCADRGWSELDSGAVSSMGWGGNLEATGFQTPEVAGLSADDVPNLELLWAFGFPDATEVRTKPTVVGDALVVGGPFGEVLALDAATGCVRWSFEADAAVRGAVLVGVGKEGRTTAFFADFRTNAYALDVTTGEVLWKYHVGRHPTSNTTGSPALHDGRLFVPVSSWEAVVSADPRYECCTASGAVAALDAATGDLLWYHRVIPGYPEEAGTNDVGTQLWAPSGAPVWSSPTVDVARGLVYAGTGENYTRPTTENSDAIIAIEIETGELAWSFQATPDDAFTMACTSPTARQNCPDPPGPDLDFGMSPMLVTRLDGTEILVAGQKSGVVWALDPDDDGAVLWSTRIGKGSALGGIHWGMAADGRYAYAPVADRDAVIVDVNPERDPSPGMYALDLMNGDVAWSVPAPKGACEGKRGCWAALSAASTAVPEVVFSGGLDGYIRAYGADDGRILWEFDTTEVTETSNGVAGRGGAIDGPGPVIAGGLLFTNSGYSPFGQMPGNLLLAFGVR